MPTMGFVGTVLTVQKGLMWNPPEREEQSSCFAAARNRRRFP